MPVAHRLPRAAYLVAVLIVATGAAWPAASQEICWSRGGAQFYDAIHYCVSSVLSPQGASTYGPNNLADGDPATAWCEGAAGPGIGETITVRVDGGPPFRRLLIGNGYGKSPQAFADNGRIKTVEITADTGVHTMTSLVDQAGVLPVYLPTPAQRWVRLRIVDVYPGARFADTCLTSIGPDFEHEEELLRDKPSRN